METVQISERIQLKALNELLVETVNATSWNRPYNQRKSKKPGFLIVKDKGAYVMSAVDRPEGQLPKVAYFNFFGPQDKDVWERSREVFGGDDFGVFVGLDPKVVAHVKNGGKVLGFKVQVRPTTFVLDWVLKTDNKPTS